MRMPDTNCIYPPDNEYAQKNEDLKSPVKKRPQSGGPSPDKHKLYYIKHDQEEEHAIMMKCHEVLKEHNETTQLLIETKAELVKTRLEIEKDIAHSKQSISKYKNVIAEN